MQSKSSRHYFLVKANSNLGEIVNTKTIEEIQNIINNAYPLSITEYDFVTRLELALYSSLKDLISSPHEKFQLQLFRNGPQDSCLVIKPNCSLIPIVKQPPYYWDFFVVHNSTVIPKVSSFLLAIHLHSSTCLRKSMKSY